MRPPAEMMQDDDKPVDREAWQRVLKRGAGEPPRSTDERIRAEARRAVAPHTGRWWLPASLAASLLLAVLIVQWQYEGTEGPALVTESDVAPPVPQEATAPGEPGTAAPTVAPAADAAATSMPAPAEERFAPPPMVEVPAAPAPAPVGKAAPAQEAAAPPVTGLRQVGSLRSKEEAAAQLRTPEQWYSEIEALRAAGRSEEADAELARLEEAYPGWLEEHVPKDR